MILVSGGTGFVGSAVCRELRRRTLDYRVLTRSPKEKNHIYFDFMEFDCTKLQNFKFTEISLIHCAWYVNHKDYETSDENLKWKDATEKFVNFLSKHNLVHVLGIGSGSEYFPSPIPKTHWANLSSNNLYAGSKICTQKKIKQICDKKNIPFAWARVFFIYGNHEAKERLIPQILHAKMNKRKLKIKAANKIIDIRNVDHVAKDLVFLSENKKNGNFNVSSGQGKSIRQIVRNLVSDHEYKTYFEFSDVHQHDHAVGINNVYDHDAI